MTTKNTNASTVENQEVVIDSVPMTFSGLTVGVASLADFKEVMSKNYPVIAALPDHIRERATVEGLYRLLSAETAGRGDTIMTEAEKICARLSRGFWSTRDEKAATIIPVTPSIKGKTGVSKFSRTEILGALRDVTPEEKHGALEAVAALDDRRFSAFIVARLKVPGIVAEAIALLDERAEAKAKRELDALLMELAEIDL